MVNEGLCHSKIYSFIMITYCLCFRINLEGVLFIFSDSAKKNYRLWIKLYVERPMRSIVLAYRKTMSVAMMLFVEVQYV